MDLTWLAAVGAFATAMSWSPGPNNTMLAASGANFGPRRSVAHMLGVALGFPAMLLAVALGLANLLRLLPWLQEAMRWVGEAYLIYLAVRIATAEPRAEGAAARGRPLSFVAAAAFQWINPKAWIIALGAVATYTTGQGQALFAQAAAVAAVFVLVTLPACAVWTLLGSGAARVLRGPGALRWFNRAMAGLLLASLLPLAWH